MSGQQWRVTDEYTLERFLEFARAQVQEHGEVTFEWQTGPQTRTAKQNAALHVYCRLLADALNSAGLDLREVIKPGVEINWSQHSVKEYLWRPVQKALTGEKSTTRPSTKDYPQIHETITRHLAERFGLPPVEWPVKEKGKGNAGQ